MTTLELQFMEELAAEAYGGTLFTDEINPAGMSKAQKSGVVSSLTKKGIIISSQDGFQQIGIIPEGGDWFDAEYEISEADVREAIARAEAK